MANATVTVLEADGVTQTDVVVLDVGRQAAAASKSVATCTEDKAVLDAIAASLALLDNSIAAGNELQVDVVAALPAGTNNIGDVDVLSIIPGTGATNLGKAVDSAAGGTDTGVAVLAVRDDVVSSLTPVEGDYVPLRVDDAGRLHVTIDTTQVPDVGAATAAASLPVAFATDQFVLDDEAFTAGISRVLPVGYFADEASTDSVTEGDIGAARMTLDRKIIVNPQPHTAGGLSAWYHIDVDESPTGQEVKSSPGCLYKMRITNYSTSPRYVRLYNLAVGDVTVGSETHLDVIPVPAGSSTAPTVITESFGGIGLTFSVALTIAATTGLAENDTGAPSANDVVVSAYYK
jgi:hypothetical protein